MDSSVNVMSNIMFDAKLHVSCNLNKKFYRIAILVYHIYLYTPCNFASNMILLMTITLESIFSLVLWFYHFSTF